MGISEVKAISTRMSEYGARQSIKPEPGSSTMKTTTSIKSGGYRWNHSQTTAGVKVKSAIKAGEEIIPPTKPAGTAFIGKGG